MLKSMFIANAITKVRHKIKYGLNRFWSIVITICIFAFAYTISGHSGAAAVTSSLKVIGFGHSMLTGIVVLIILPYGIEKFLSWKQRKV